MVDAVQWLAWNGKPDIAWLCDFIGIPPDSKITVCSNDTNPPSYYLLISAPDGPKPVSKGQIIAWDDDRNLYACESEEDVHKLLGDD